MSPELILALIVIGALVIAYWRKESELAAYKKIGDKIAKENVELKRKVETLSQWGDR